MCSKNIKLSNLDFHMQRIKKSYLYQFKDESHIFEIEKEKFVKIVGDLFIEYNLLNSQIHFSKPLSFLNN